MPLITVNCADYNVDSDIVKALSTKALMPHSIPESKLWKGKKLSRAEIVCNLAALHVNVIGPLFSHFGTANLRVNSGYRTGTGSSQHNAGMAADIQVKAPQGKPSVTLPFANWIKDNCVFDQLAMEYSENYPKQCWIHVSFNRTGTNRKAIYTWDAAKLGTPQFSKPNIFEVRE